VDPESGIRYHQGIVTDICNRYNRWQAHQNFCNPFLTIFSDNTPLCRLRDIFLDGNTFKKSHRVEKECLVADLMVGIAFCYQRFKISYAYTFQTKEFEGQGNTHKLGSLSISCTY
jgi:hypothetical protein